MSKYTPGPWKAIGDKIYSADQRQVAHVYALVHPNDLNVMQSIPNARLLAAAPELLTALRACCVMMVNVRGLKENHYQEWIDRFKLIEKNSAKLIKKIEGDEGED